MVLQMARMDVAADLLEVLERNSIFKHIPSSDEVIKLNW